ncbi:response regulator, partial [Methyloversatilis discipulorum]|uniref:response regulator n=1 Tax=Methyloversatilis discipulorum TaxID=1119528 RepID=UPI003AF4F04F
HPPAVVMVSAYGADDLQHAGAGLAIAGVLTKPASTSSLYDAIVSALGHQVAAEGSSGDAPGSFRSDALRGRRVLLVEDNPINQELGVEILTGAGVRVTVAENGAEALRRLDAEEFDCVLMDVQMPVMDGLEATREIRRRERLNKLPVIAMTAGAMPWEREQTRAAGMDDHVTKPVDVDELLRTLTRWLGSVPLAEPAADSSAPTADATPLLDTAAALRSMNGASATYRRVLGMFLDSADDAQTQLKQAWTDRDFDAVGQLAHRHKGSAAALGARALSAALGAVEMACRSGDPAAIDAAMTNSTPIFAATVEAMRVQADAGSLAPPSATELDTLHALLSSNDSDAQEAIARLLARAQPADILPVLRQMSRAMERYDFDAALLQLAQLRTTIAAGAADASGVEGQI